MTSRHSRPRPGPVRRLRARRPGGFTLLELLTVLIIILVLIGILIPTVKKVREKAQEASVRAQISALDSAISRYQQDFNAFPGPLPRNALYPTLMSSLPPAQQVHDKAAGGVLAGPVSGAENLVLGLMGGLAPRAGGGFDFDKNLIGRGPRSLNTSNPKAYTAYLDGVTLSEGNYQDGAGAAIDSVIPEIVDRFANPLPILYLRAQPGARAVVSIENEDSANADVLTPAAPTQYDIREIFGYTTETKGSIGEGKSIKVSDYKNATGVSAGVLPHGLRTVKDAATMDKSDATDYAYPYDALPYFSNPSIPPTNTNPGFRNATGTPRNKDRYILISAGVDRVYGTADDITNFGNVVE